MNINQGGALAFRLEILGQTLPREEAPNIMELVLISKRSAPAFRKQKSPEDIMSSGPWELRAVQR